MTVDGATIAKAIAQAAHDEPSMIDELVALGLPVDLLRKFLPPPRPAMDVARAPSGFSSQAHVFWARMDDGSWAMAMIDPTEAA